MIYTVECSFADPACEEEWNDFYSLEKLPALISVSGFHTSQRFKALSANCPVYLAMHSISDMAVLESDEYQRKGGGNFARWQQHIIDWHRNLYDGIERAPAIDGGEHLILSEVGAEPLIDMGLTPVWMRAAALEKCPENRWLAKLDRSFPLSLKTLVEGVHLYAPLTAQLAGSNVAKALATEPNQHA